MLYKIKYNPQYSESIKGIYDYISKKNEMAALGIILSIDSAINKLIDMPNRGRDLSLKLIKNKLIGIKFLLIENYYIFYEMKNDYIEILDVIHSSQNFIKILKLNQVL